MRLLLSPATPPRSKKRGYRTPIVATLEESVSQRTLYNNHIPLSRRAPNSLGTKHTHTHTRSSTRKRCDLEEFGEMANATTTTASAESINVEREDVAFSGPDTSSNQAWLNFCIWTTIIIIGGIIICCGFTGFDATVELRRRRAATRVHGVSRQYHVPRSRVRTTAPLTTTSSRPAVSAVISAPNGGSTRRQQHTREPLIALSSTLPSLYATELKLHSTISSSLPSTASAASTATTSAAAANRELGVRFDYDNNAFTFPRAKRATTTLTYVTQREQSPLPLLTFPFATITDNLHSKKKSSLFPV